MMDIERKLYNLGIPLGKRDFIAAILVITAVLFVIFYMVSPVYAPFALSIPILALLFLDFLHGLYVGSVESEIPRFVHLSSTYPVRTLKDVIHLGTRGFGNLSREMISVEKKVREGIPPERALMALSYRLGSPYVERVMRSIVVAFRTGVSSKLLENLSEELYFMEEMERERRGSLALQRYSILLSAAFLVPFILGLVVSVATRIGGSSPVVGYIVPYLLLLSFISGSFVAWSEGKAKRSPVYILLVGAVSVGVYSVVLWLY